MTGVLQDDDEGKRRGDQGNSIPRIGLQNKPTFSHEARSISRGLQYR